MKRTDLFAIPALLALLVFLLSACTPPTPTAALVTPTPAPALVTPTTAPATDGLTAQQAATLDSLRKVDAHPLYTMNYVGAYSTQQSFSLPPLPTAGQSWGCALFAALGDASHMFYGRNFDWEPSPAVLLFTEPPGGYASVSMVDIKYLGFTGDRADNLAGLPLAERRALLGAPSLPFDGMNARGLAIGMAAVDDGQMKDDPSKPTIGSLMVMRKILDSAATVDEAVAIFRQYNLDMSGGPALHYLIADQAGRAVLVEFYRGTMYVIPNETRWHQATNFIQSSVQNPTGQCWRRDTIAQRLGQTKGSSNPREAMQLLHDVSQNITQWSIVYGMSEGDVTVTMGRRYETQHQFNLKLNR